MGKARDISAQSDELDSASMPSEPDAEAENPPRSGIKVLDRAVSIIKAISESPLSLPELSESTGLPRATAHRLATALETHHMLNRTADGRWSLGPALPNAKDRLLDAASASMNALMNATGESVQLYQASGNTRLCLAAVEPTSGLHNMVPVGSRLPLSSGSAARVIVAYADPDTRTQLLKDAAFTADDLEQVQQHGWAESLGEREAGLASVSAPVFDSTGRLVAALSVSGPLARMDAPGAMYAQQLCEAAHDISRALGASTPRHSSHP